jgi:hypothetical protein
MVRDVSFLNKIKPNTKQKHLRIFCKQIYLYIYKDDCILGKKRSKIVFLLFCVCVTDPWKEWKRRMAMGAAKKSKKKKKNFFLLFFFLNEILGLFGEEEKESSN